MLHCATYNDENVKKYTKAINGLENLEICYMEDPMGADYYLCFQN
jgi:hypothetical protein